MSVFRIGASPPPSFDDPIGMLEACHRRIEQKLEALARASAALATDTPAALAALAEVVGYFDQAGTRHKEDEEFSLFPRVPIAFLNTEIFRITKSSECLLLCAATVLLKESIEFSAVDLREYL